MSKCYKNNGRIKHIRGVSADRRYYGVCDDCGFEGSPESLNGAVATLRIHHGVQPIYNVTLGKKGFQR